MKIRLLARIFTMMGIISTFILSYITFIFITTETPELLLWVNIKPILIIVTIIFTINGFIYIFTVLDHKIWYLKETLEEKKLELDEEIEETIRLRHDLGKTVYKYENKLMKLDETKSNGIKKTLNN